MAAALTPKIYARLRDKTTPSNWTVDQCIQTGVDNPGHPFIKTVGMVAGDEESYEVGVILLSELCLQLLNGENCVSVWFFPLRCLLSSLTLWSRIDTMAMTLARWSIPLTWMPPRFQSSRYSPLHHTVLELHLLLLTLTWYFLLLRSPQECLTSATCCQVVCVQVAASVDWVFLLRAHVLSAVRWSVWLWPLCLAWRETWLVATTAWETCLTESSNSLLMLVHTHTHTHTHTQLVSFLW